MSLMSSSSLFLFREPVHHLFGLECGMQNSGANSTL
uniref:Uncharacterized protein n=1 Tax=Arundo donax TaxID=35708 RepID=A0A0A9HMJ4_ARUDO